MEVRPWGRSVSRRDVCRGNSIEINKNFIEVNRNLIEINRNLIEIIRNLIEIKII